MSKYATSTIPIHQILSLIAEDKDDKVIVSKVNNAVDNVIIKPDSITLHFTDGIVVLIRSYYGDYNLYISDISYYSDSDTPFSLYSLDRVKWYLEKVVG